MIQHELVDGGQLPEHRQQVDLEALLHCKRARQSEFALVQVADGRVQARQAVARAHRLSGRGGAPLPAARRARHEDVVRLASPRHLRRRSGQLHCSSGLSDHQAVTPAALPHVPALRPARRTSSASSGASWEAASSIPSKRAPCMFHKPPLALCTNHTPHSTAQSRDPRRVETRRTDYRVGITVRRGPAYLLCL